MEALRRLQGKCSISAGVVAVLAFFGAGILVVGLCATAILRKKRANFSKEQIVGEGGSASTVTEEKFPEQRNYSGSCGAVKKALMGSVLWSRGAEWGGWGEAEGQTLREIAAAAAAVVELPGENGGGRHGSPLSPVWQRRILMGERCELPRFSGLILYDDRGRPLRAAGDAARQEKAAPVITTLRDLL